MKVGRVESFFFSCLFSDLSFTSPAVARLQGPHIALTNVGAVRCWTWSCFAVSQVSRRRVPIQMSAWWGRVLGKQVPCLHVWETRRCEEADWSCCLSLQERKRSDFCCQKGELYLVYEEQLTFFALAVSNFGTNSLLRNLKFHCSASISLIWFGVKYKSVLTARRGTNFIFGMGKIRTVFDQRYVHSFFLSTIYNVHAYIGALCVSDWLYPHGYLQRRVRQRRAAESARSAERFSILHLQSKLECYLPPFPWSLMDLQFSWCLICTTCQSLH